MTDPTYTPSDAARAYWQALYPDQCRIPTTSIYDAALAAYDAGAAHERAEPAPILGAPMAINVIRTRQAVYQGDHGQDISTALDVPRDMTVGELVDLHLMRDEGYPNRRVVDEDAYLTIRLAVPNRPAPETFEDLSWP